MDALIAVVNVEMGGGIDGGFMKAFLIWGCVSVHV